MKHYFQCIKTVFQQKDGESVKIEVHGRVLNDLQVGDILTAVDAQYNFNCKIISIEAYQRSLQSIETGMTCSLIVLGNDYLYNFIEFLDQ